MKIFEVLHKFTLVFGTATPAVLYFITGIGLFKLAGFIILAFFIAQHAFQLFLATNDSTYATLAAKMLPSLTTLPTITAKSSLEAVALGIWVFANSYVIALCSIVHIALYAYLALKSRAQ